MKHLSSNLLLGAALIPLLSANALAGSGTVTGKDASGVTHTWDVITDGSGNFVWMNGICDGTAAAQCAAVKASSASATATDPSLVIAISPNSNLVAATQSGTWTFSNSSITANQGGAPWSVVNGSSTATIGSVSQNGAWAVELGSSTATIGSVSQNGTWTILLGSSTAAIGTVTVSSGTVAVSSGTVSVLPASISTWGIMTGTVPGTAPGNTQIIGAIYNTASPSPSNGQTLPLQLDSSGNLNVNIKAGAGSGGTALADEGTFTQGTTNFTPIGGIFNSTISNLTSGQAGAVQLTNDRNMFVNLNKLAGTALGAPSNYGTSPGAVEVQGVNAFVTNANANGAATMSSSSPVAIATDQQVSTRNSSTAIAVSSASTSQLVATSGSTKIYVTQFDFVAAGANNVQLEYGTGASCSTATVLTGSYALSTNTGIVAGNGQAALFVVPTSATLCMITSTSVSVAGLLTYQQF